MAVKAHTAATRQAISRALIGRGKSQETRASMAASKKLGFGRDADPELWDAVYAKKLARIKAIDEAIAALQEDETE